MLLRFFFNQLSIKKQAEYLRRKGILLGTRNKEGRKVYIYMLTNLFVEVVFAHDNTEENAESVYTLTGLKNLNEYLEKEFRASF